ncbi:MAG: hypothetical protein WBN04_14575 [Paracoccaceae bacterium]
MSIRILALAAASALVAGTASAQTASPGDLQLALQAGVQPGAYSTSQLIRLLEAQRDNETNRINFILNERDDMTTRLSTDMPAAQPTPSFGTGVNSDKF